MRASSARGAPVASPPPSRSRTPCTTRRCSRCWGRRELARASGRELKTTGDGFVAAFDGPARAIRCARAVCDAARRLGLAVRTGLHSGECVARGDDLSGLALHIGARVAALARPHEVLVTSTVRDLVLGAGFDFEDRGLHAPKGVPGEWRVFAVAGA
jgi:class 3 adenylate cyclase